MDRLFCKAAALLVCVGIATAVTCEEGYTCWEDTSDSEGVVWVKKDDGNTNGPTCKSVCETAFSQSTDFYVCDQGRNAYHSKEELQPIADGMGFNCDAGGECWDANAPGTGLMLVTRGDNNEKRCYFPTEETLECNTHPGNANCYGERYSILCPCVPKALDDACVWDSPPYVPANPTFEDHADPEATDCLNRINYWRKVACEEEWVECPPNGLPPMTECTCCHECANSESEYDKENGAHSSFKRCGERVQGQGGGSNCAAVIDAFVSERRADENGVVRCTGHCGPIVKPGCLTFFWGRDRDSGFHTLNWRSCNWEQCNRYCNDSSANECFALDDESLRPNTCGCDDIDGDHSECQTQNNGGNGGRNSDADDELSDGEVAGIAIGAILGGILFCGVIAALMYFFALPKYREYQEKNDNSEGNGSNDTPTQDETKPEGVEEETTGMVGSSAGTQVKEMKKSSWMRPASPRAKKVPSKGRRGTAKPPPRAANVSPR